ncbi:hypothetical protein E0L36_01035 [Streptomyces sp. AJS327]|uniref:hypothetical protein n=1 Tax=Streptomyces sp. AJS327 TaxID=2545265 RepID=UPI0015DECA20|nr:hypothetical protein [Streptomyces sp. AJS327]MBA0049542.1 hypothetical protein [Streptomyces sp. AJS327]
MVHLCGYHSLLDEFVPALIGLERHGNALLDSPFPNGPPVIQLTGGVGAGKSAPLAALQASYRDRIPAALLDVGAPSVTLRRDGPSSALPVPGAVHRLARDVAASVPGRRGVPFPRSQIGLLVMARWHAVSDTSNPQLNAAETQLASLLEDQNVRDGMLRGPLRRWLELLPGVLQDVFPMVPYLGSVASTAVQVVPELHQRGRTGGRTVEWWGEQLTPYFQGGPLEKLARFLFTLEAPEGDPDFADELLFRALLADISAHYGQLRRWNKLPRPLLMLDNTHTETGDRLTAALLRAYAAPFDTGTLTRPVILLTALGDPSGLTSAEQVAEAGKQWAGQPAHDTSPGRWLLPLAAPQLSRHQVRQMFPTNRPPSTHATGIIQRRCGGRAGSIHAMVTVLREPPREGTTREQQELAAVRALAHHLVRNQEAREWLPLLSVALDGSAAKALWREFHDGLPDTRPDDGRNARPDDRPDGEPDDGPDDGPGDGPEDGPAGGSHSESWERKALTLLPREDHWQQEKPWPGLGSDTPLVRDYTVRTAFSQLLAADDPDLWARAHRRARAVYCSDQRDPGPFGTREHSVQCLHHTLALGDRHAVVCALHTKFARRVPEEQRAPEEQRTPEEERRAEKWLSDLQIVCAAPRPPSGMLTDAEANAPGESGRCSACVHESDRGPHRVIAALVDLLWSFSAPDTVPDVDEIETFGQKLMYLAGVPAGSQTYTRAAHAWTRSLVHGVKPPHLPRL